jgi:hypothetical protein
MLTKKVVFYLAIRFPIVDFKFKVFSTPNIYLLFVIMLNSNHAILVKNKCLRRIKARTYLNRVVLESLFIDGLILLIAIPYKLVYTKM